MAEGEMKVTHRILKEGVLQKRSSLLKQWRQRFLILNQETLCVFKKEEDEKRGRTAEGRLFVMDISSLDKYNSKKKKFCFFFAAEGRTYYFCCVSEIDRELWLRAIKTAKEAEFKEEENDPIRRKSMKLTGGLKRITIEREKGRGLGCTIKNVGGVIFVNRILEDGVVSSSGVLRPGDQLLDINGIELTRRTVSEISEIIRSSPVRVVCTVKPATDFRFVDTHETASTDYAELDLSSLKLRKDSSEASSGSEGPAEDNADHPPVRVTDGGSAKSTSTKERSNTPDNNAPPEKSTEDPYYDDVIPINDQRRHSLPPCRPPREPIPQGERSKEQLNYLELNFPVCGRPRVKSDVPPRPSKKPVQKPAASETKHEIAAYAYIELDFKNNFCEEMKKNEGEAKTSSLPISVQNREKNEEKRKSSTVPKQSS